MRPVGLAAIDVAKQDGRWKAAYDPPSSTKILDDFLTELNKNSIAKQFFATLNKANIYAFCWRVQTAKKPETRKARIDKFIEMLNKGERLH
jgi:uncharacterized protein YdeI (YjbR/CyaY-like superfamily)